MDTVCAALIADKLTWFFFFLFCSAGDLMSSLSEDKEAEIIQALKPTSMN